jgi:hypothetical protein
MYLNSLRLFSQTSLWADSAVLLRTMALLDIAQPPNLLSALVPIQLEPSLP